MKYRILLLITLLAGLFSCKKALQPDELPSDSLYSGTVSVDYDDGVYDNEGITVAFLPSENGKTAQIIIYKIKFVPKMPVRIDVTIPEVKMVRDGQDILLSCDDVIPLALGGEYPKYRVTALEGRVEGNKLQFSLNFGDYPTRFSGKR